MCKDGKSRAASAIDDLPEFANILFTRVMCSEISESVKGLSDI